MADDGVVEGRRVLPEGWVAEATRPGSEAVAYGGLYEGYPLGYGYQWWLLPNGRFEAQGVYGQLIYVAPAAGVVIVKLSHWPEAWVPALEMESYAFFDAVVAAVGKQGTADGSDDGEQ
jgi:CubicO group peptidase (beta-lactamase class C family)